MMRPTWDPSKLGKQLWDWSGCHQLMVAICQGEDVTQVVASGRILYNCKKP